MANLSFDPDLVKHRLSTQLAGVLAELAERDAMLEAAMTHIAELEQKVAELSPAAPETEEEQHEDEGDRTT